MVILIIFVHKSICTDLVIYVTLSIFEKKSSSVKLSYQQLTFEKGHFQDIKASNFVRSISCSMCFCNSRIRKQRSLIMIRYHYIMISERSFDFGNLLTLGIFYYFILL